MSYAFASLTHARDFRDSRLVYMLNDAERVYEPEEAARIVDSIARGESEYQVKIYNLKKACFGGWDGNGSPDWSYMDAVGDAVEYLVKAEKEGVAEAISAASSGSGAQRAFDSVRADVAARLKLLEENDDGHPMNYLQTNELKFVLKLFDDMAQWHSLPNAKLGDS